MSDKLITKQDLDELEKFADKLFRKVNIDVNFSRHFHDRVNDARNKKAITMSELTRLFKQTFKRYGKELAKYGPDFEAVLRDMKTDVNLPFVLVWDSKNNELDLIGKTVMRKKNFKTSNQTLAFESYEKVADYPVEVPGYGRLTVESAEKNVKGKIRELEKLARSGSTADMRKIKTRIDSGVLQAILKSLTEAYDEIEKDPELSEYLDESNCRSVDKEIVKSSYENYKSELDEEETNWATKIEKVLAKNFGPGYTVTDSGRHITVRYEGDDDPDAYRNLVKLGKTFYQKYNLLWNGEKDKNEIDILIPRQ